MINSNPVIQRFVGLLKYFSALSQSSGSLYLLSMVHGPVRFYTQQRFVVALFKNLNAQAVILKVLQSLSIALSIHVGQVCCCKTLSLKGLCSLLTSLEHFRSGCSGHCCSLSNQSGPANHSPFTSLPTPDPLLPKYVKFLLVGQYFQAIPSSFETSAIVCTDIPLLSQVSDPI